MRKRHSITPFTVLPFLILAACNDRPQVTAPGAAQFSVSSAADAASYDARANVVTRGFVHYLAAHRLRYRWIRHERAKHH